MWDWLRKIFDTSGFPSRWNCGTGWAEDPWLGWLHIVADLLTFVAYTGIPLVLVYLIRKRQDLPFPGIFWFFCLFIFSCGTVHLIEAAIFFEPLYRLSGLVKALTALVSLATLVLMVPFVRQALALPGRAAIADQLEQEVEVRRASEHALRQSEERLAETQRIAQLGSFDFVPEADPVLQLSELSSKLTQGLDEAELLALRDQHSGRRLGSLLLAAAEAEEPLDATVKLPEGASLRLQFRASEPGRVVGTCQDISEELAQLEKTHALERSMLQSQKLESLGAMAGGIAHEFNNVLMGVIGYTDMALDLSKSEPQLHKLIQKTRSAANQAAHLCNQMLAYSGKGRFINESLDLNATLAQVVGLAEVAVGAKNQIEFYFDAAQLEVLGDPAQLTQAFMNLVNNASEAQSEAGGRIRVYTGSCELDAERRKALQDGAEVEESRFHFLRVEDEGEGMDPKTLQRITEPFFSTRFAGRGLGMATVRGIVRGHGGLLEVRSEQGAGTQVSIYLPAQSQEQPRSEASQPSPGSGFDPAAGAILVIDDDTNSRDVCSTILKRSGFRVLEAEQGETGLERFDAAAEDIQAVILDLTMPGLSGVDVYTDLQRRRPGCPVLLISGFSQEEVHRRFAGQRAPRHFLAKPFGSTELLAAIARLAEERDQEHTR